MESLPDLIDYKYHSDDQTKIGVDNYTRINNNSNIELREKIENLFNSENSEPFRIESINSIKNHNFNNSFEEISQIEDSHVLNLLIDLINDSNEHISQSAFNTIIQIASISEDYALLIFEQGICPICRQLISNHDKLIDVLALLNNISSYGGVFSRRAFQILPFSLISGLLSEFPNLNLVARYILNTMKSFITDRSFMKHAFSFLFDILQKKDIDSTCLILSFLRKMAKDDQLAGFKQNVNEISGFIINEVKSGISCPSVIYQSLLFIGFMVKKRIIDGIDFNLFKSILNYHKANDLQVVKACLWCVNELVLNKRVVVDSNFLSDFLIKNQSVITLSRYEVKREYCLFITTTHITIANTIRFTEFNFKNKFERCSHCICSN
ncbi:hypothetical protein TVAG_445320 [Trichomonas vaginalis G3]|uniref:Armadillo repeat-containing domain-containing protein n=1 Tax=Trichomonas vaginalis (strain ATCC PRA-98 / G3) TaxID=412133 RepID=A2E4J8_TRIV3|nr:hypothetical protein TVAG_445320 [Trichomonas vaginalis G3]|eukprot:XP_001324643.1 hypothetical protein [Trichomonas vaginalis G3]